MWANTAAGSMAGVSPRASYARMAEEETGKSTSSR